MGTGGPPRNRTDEYPNRSLRDCRVRAARKGRRTVGSFERARWLPSFDVARRVYGLIELDNESEHLMDGLPSWMPEVTVRTGHSDLAGRLTLLRFEGSERSNPYIDPATGEGWADNVERFLAFSVAVAELANTTGVDVLHCNDWHTAPAISLAREGIGTVLTVHNLAHQGTSDVGLAARLGTHGCAYVENGHFNALAGGLSLADHVVMVSESHAVESVRVESGFGLHERLIARGDRLLGIRNGIDPGLWDPAVDPMLPVTFDHTDLSGKEMIGLVARFVHQKGIDLALDMAPYLASLPARLVLIGSGAPELTRAANEVAARFPSEVHVFSGYDEELAHLVVAGSDLLLMPSRFEPCGLTQMQAMTCGTIPVVTGVGGLRDTVTDTDRNPRSGTGFVAAEATSIALLDTIHRAARGWANTRRRASVQRRGMTADWSWAEPARQYVSLYESSEKFSQST